MTLGFAWAVAVPAAIQAVGLGINLLLGRRRGAQKIAATRIVEQLEPLLKQNVEAYLSGPRTQSAQAAALANFDQAWAWLTSPEGCGNPELGKPGIACIDDRKRGGKFDWFAAYRDPIANDTPAPDPTPLEQLESTGWVLPALLILGGLLL